MYIFVRASNVFLIMHNFPWASYSLKKSSIISFSQSALQQGADSDLCWDPLLRGRTPGPRQEKEVSWRWRRPGAALVGWIQSHSVSWRPHELRAFVLVWNWCSVDHWARKTCSQNIRNIKNKLLCRSYFIKLSADVKFLLNLFETKYHFNITKSSNISNSFFATTSCLLFVSHSKVSWVNLTRGGSSRARERVNISVKFPTNC